MVVLAARVELVSSSLLPQRLDRKGLGMRNGSRSVSTK